MAAYSYGSLVYNSRLTQLVCIVIQIFVLYSHADYIGSGTFILSTALAIYNLYVVGKRWHNNIDGRFDMRQMVRESDAQLKLMYAAEVFTPFLLGAVIFLMVRLPGGGGNFMWTCSCCVQIVSAFALIIAEFYEVFIRGY
ncbi:hypothetical protein Q1695_008244 [Nippostrongylus brasiliensis]|nr:hypothetical protein Q1695_008244 [Nippostrongylus brasiliensis]